MNKQHKIFLPGTRRGRNNRPAVALLLTLIVLVVLSTVVYTLTARLSIIKHRRQYIIDYQIARYASDSAMKYALVAIERLQLKLADRKDDPDFSDLFTLDRGEYQQLLNDWAQKRSQELREQDLEDELAGTGGLEQAQPQDLSNLSTDMSNLTGQNKSLLDNFLKELGGEAAAILDPNKITDDMQDDYAYDPYYIDPNSIEIPGPYGPQWPYVTEPIEFEIGDVKVIIEIEDENAKMPLIWALAIDKKLARDTDEALQIFCEWMQMYPDQIEDLKDQLKKISKKKAFVTNLKALDLSIPSPPKKAPKQNRRTRRRPIRRTPAKKPTKKTRPAIAHTADYARLMQSSMLDREILAIPLPRTGWRYESPLKYLGLWGSQKVNINTAPRHVLEAALTFGGQAPEIAHEIIKARQEKPFKSIKELKDKFYGYSAEIKKDEPYLTTTSTFLAIKVTAVSGAAKTASVATVVKQGKNIKRIGMMSY
jgi:type II secretory pathway component PulK